MIFAGADEPNKEILSVETTTGVDNEFADGPDDPPNILPEEPKAGVEELAAQNVLVPEEVDEPKVVDEPKPEFTAVTLFGLTTADAVAVPSKLNPEPVVEECAFTPKPEVLAGAAPKENPDEGVAETLDPNVDELVAVDSVEDAKRLEVLLGFAVKDPKLRAVAGAEFIKLLFPKLKPVLGADDVDEIVGATCNKELGSEVVQKLIFFAAATDGAAEIVLEDPKLKVVFGVDTVEVTLLGTGLPPNENPASLLVLEEDAGPKLNAGLVSAPSLTEFGLSLKPIAAFVSSVFVVGIEKVAVEVAPDENNGAEDDGIE